MTENPPHQRYHCSNSQGLETVFEAHRRVPIVDRLESARRSPHFPKSTSVPSHVPTELEIAARGHFRTMLDGPCHPTFDVVRADVCGSFRISCSGSTRSRNRFCGLQFFYLRFLPTEDQSTPQAYSNGQAWL